MYLTVRQKQEIFKYLTNIYNNTVGSEGQIYILTYRIKHITEHLKYNKRDLNTIKSLRKIVHKRKRILNYIKKNKPNSYISIIKELFIIK